MFHWFPFRTSECDAASLTEVPFLVNAGTALFSSGQHFSHKYFPAQEDQTQQLHRNWCHTPHLKSLHKHFHNFYKKYYFGILKWQANFIPLDNLNFVFFTWQFSGLPVSYTMVKPPRDRANAFNQQNASEVSELTSGTLRPVGHVICLWLTAMPRHHCLSCFKWKYLTR